jgi:hypothetical protein
MVNMSRRSALTALNDWEAPDTCINLDQFASAICVIEKLRAFNLGVRLPQERALLIGRQHVDDG